MSLLIKRPKRFPNESLASYIYRLSNENACKINWIYKPIKIRLHCEYQVLNSFPNKELISIISDRTGLSEKELLSMTISKFNFWRNFSESDYLYYFKKSSKFCPLCLKENNYHRIYWQLGFIKICLEHNIVLVDRCSCGKMLSIEEVINGRCSCGLPLLDIDYSENNNESVYFNQLRLYYAMDIEFNNKKRINLNSSLCLEYDKKIFLGLYDLLNYIVDLGNIDRTIEELKEIYLIQLTNNDKLVSSQLIEEILKEWPTNLYKFLDYKNLQLEICERPLSEVSSLFLPILSYEKKYYLELFPDIIIKYLLLRYKYIYKAIFKKAHDNRYIIIDESYISAYILRKDFGIPYENDEVKSLFKTITIENNTYALIDDVLDFFYNFFEKAELLTDVDNESYIQITKLYDSLLFLGCTLKMIVDVVLNNYINIKIDIFYTGLSMIFVEKNKAIKYILHELLKLYEEDNTFTTTN